MTDEQRVQQDGYLCKKEGGRGEEGGRGGGGGKDGDTEQREREGGGEGAENRSI